MMTEGAATGSSARPAPVVDSDTESEPEYVQYKVIIVGDGAVGKTSLLQRFTEDAFGKSYKQTIGCDFTVKRLDVKGTNVCLQIWDIGGQSIGGKMIGKYIHGSDVVLLCYDISNYQSFQDLEDWLSLVRKNTETMEKKPYLAIVGTKMDLAHLRAVKPEKHNAFAEEHELYSYFVSAKTGENVHPTFYRVAADLAGVALTKPELEVAQKVVKAELINHVQNDPQYKEVTAEDLPKKKQCVIM